MDDEPSKAQHLTEPAKHALLRRIIAPALPVPSQVDGWGGLGSVPVQCSNQLTSHLYVNFVEAFVYLTPGATKVRSFDKVQVSDPIPEVR